MSVPSNTFLTYSAVGNLDDLANIIYMVDPYECPFLTGIESVRAINTLHEWQIQTLAAASGTNAVEEGDDATTDSTTATTRPSNTCQILDKVPRVSGTQQDGVKSAGRTDEMAMQVYLKSLELRRDFETSLTQNVAENAGGSTDARILGGLETWIGTNVDSGTGATNRTDGNNTRTAGATRAITEDMVASVIQATWTSGGKPTTAMCGAFNKRQISAFAGNGQRVVNGAERTLHPAIDIYDSDFGDIEVIPSRLQNQATVFILEMPMFAVAYLRGWRMHDLAKTGDSERKQLLLEATLEARQQASSGAVYDLSTS